MATDFLDLELRLLVLKYGRSRLVQSLAQIEGSTPEEVQSRLEKLAGSRPPSKVKRESSGPEIVERLSIDEAKKLKLLDLAREYEHKRLFPQLRDVIRFCGQHGHTVRPKSRQDALPRVLRVLATLSESELDELDERVDTGGDGAFARLADAIIRGA